MTAVCDERAAWLALNVLPHEGELRAWLAGRRLPGLDVDDIIQETYARLISAASLAEVRNPRTYAFSTAYSVILTHARRAKIVSFQVVADLDALGAMSEEASPERRLLDREELSCLAKALAELPPKTRDIFRLRRVEGLSQRQISERLGLPESTVEKHIGRAIHLLMERFGRGGKARRRASSGQDEDHRANAQGVRTRD